MPVNNNLPSIGHQNNQVDNVQVRIRNKNNLVTNHMGSMSQTLDEQEKTKQKKRDLSQASKRLKVLE